MLPQCPPSNLVPPFTRETATLKVRAAENNWNTRILKKLRKATLSTAAGANRPAFDLLDGAYKAGAGVVYGSGKMLPPTLARVLQPGPEREEIAQTCDNACYQQ